MVNPFHDFLWSVDHGKPGHYFLHGGQTLAAWVAATPSLIPLCSFLISICSFIISIIIVRITIKTQIRLALEKKRDDQVKTLIWLDSLFNSPTLLADRRKTGKAMLNLDPITKIAKIVPPSGRPVIDLFVRVADLWDKGQLDLKDIDVAYRRHVLHIWRSFDKSLSNEHNQDRYSSLKRLDEELLKIDPKRRLDGLAAAVSTEHEEFWKSESEL